ncbi:hypothetical protein FACS1894216_09040 [Synergistales bacterium]|nr:hypothetical protein FACS1894216_09040 [Synergistales bacterium]
MSSGKKMILAVDDMQTNLQVIKIVLGDEFEVRLAKSGNVALTALDRITPDLILLDIEMPEISGFDVMDSINENSRLKTIPVIFVTSHTEPELLTEAMQKGAKDYVTKPFEPDFLRGKVRHALKVA